jgi:hypothetical protein
MEMKEVLKRLEKLPDGSESGRSSSNQDQKILRGPGRPKIGVVSREVTLLPRHWDWLNSQPGGASVALRNLSKRQDALTVIGIKCGILRKWRTGS